MGHLMADIVAFNMNPALDLASSTERVAGTSKIRCDAVKFGAGGGGINVARVARTLGANALTVFPAGGYAGQVLCSLLQESGLPHRFIPIAERTRQSLTVDESSSGDQFRFVFPGPRLTEDEQQACLDALSESMDGAKIVVVTGSLPPGVRSDFFQSIADLVQKRGLRLLLDTSGDALRSMRRFVHILKPSERELQDCVGRPLATKEEQIEAARELIGNAVADVVVVSLGAQGALLVTGDRQEAFAALQVPVRGAVGAGDSLVAGLAVGLVRGYDHRDALRLGLASAAATVSAPGAELCRRKDVERLFALSDIFGARE
ncbi:MAG: 1-phosphofructokinase family hexose kinase [Microvirga sp.]